MKLVIYWLLLLTSLEGFAFNPHFPPKKTYEAPDGKATLTLVLEGWKASLSDKAAGKAFPWPGKVEYPDRAILVPKRRYVVLLGGHGNPGTDLGRIWIYSYEGKLVKEWDLRKTIPDLEKLSEDFTKESGPFFWIKTATVDGAEKALEIDVCGKRKVKVDLEKLTLET